jgi:hypothetical protein
MPKDPIPSVKLDFADWPDKKQKDESGNAK